MFEINANCNSVHLGMIHSLIIKSIRLRMSEEQWKSWMDLMAVITVDQNSNNVGHGLDIYRIIPIRVDSSMEIDEILFELVNTGEILGRIKHLAIPIMHEEINNG